MTICTVATADQLEAYVLGRLPDAEATQFEEHYFDCHACLAQVEALQAVQHGLGVQPTVTGPVGAPDELPKNVLAWPVRIAALTAIAAALLLGFFAFRARQQPSHGAQVASAPNLPAAQPKPAAPPASAATTATQRDSDLTQLAELTLPPFQAPNLRGQTGNRLFAEGMTSYSNHDCPAAIEVLAQIPPTDEDARAARFYSGVCLIQSRDLPHASQSLRSVAAAGDSPQQEAAFYYLAQIALAQNDATAARHFLVQTVSVHGDFERRARTQLSRLHAADPSQ